MNLQMKMNFNATEHRITTLLDYITMPSVNVTYVRFIFVDDQTFFSNKFVYLISYQGQ